MRDSKEDFRYNDLRMIKLYLLWRKRFKELESKYAERQFVLQFELVWMIEELSWALGGL